MHKRKSLLPLNMLYGASSSIRTAKFAFNPILVAGSILFSTYSEASEFSIYRFFIDESPVSREMEVAVGSIAQLTLMCRISEFFQSENSFRQKISKPQTLNEVPFKKFGHDQAHLALKHSTFSLSSIKSSISNPSPARNSADQIINKIWTEISETTAWDTDKWKALRASRFTVRNQGRDGVFEAFELTTNVFHCWFYTWSAEN
jgi:hypothetical protein